ncbi:oligosaccharide flippase family protein [Halorussus halophilus]|uniref:oligosaccharide flippase family protein n=1 Tax=Halorussus halophilus TaxID=2650975 RepID=UPI00130137C9|nr:oligosaccharide flippase family protein [Halorussus halophilus]
MVSSDTLKLTTARGLSTVLMFTGISLFTRVLPPSTLGTFFLFEGVLLGLRLIADAGLDDAMKKRMSETDSPEAILSTALALKLFPLLAVLVGLLAAKSFVSDYLAPTLFPFLLAGVILQEAAYTTLSILSGERTPGKRALLEAGRYLVWILVGLPLVLSDWGARGLATGWLAGFAFVFLAGWLRTTTRLSFPRRELVSSLTTFAFYAGLGSVSSVAFNWADVLLLGHFQTPAVVSEYEVSWRVSRVALLLPAAIRTAIVPRLSNRQAAGDWIAVRNLFSTAFFYVLLLPIPIAVGAVFVGGPLLSVAFTPEYADAWLILTVLAMGQVAAAVSTFVGPGIEAVNKPRLATRGILVGFILNLSLNVALIPRYGAIGAAAATTLSLIGQLVVLAWAFTGLPRITVPAVIPDLRHFAVAVGLMAAVVGGLLHVISAEDVVSVAVIIAAGGVTYGLALTGLPTPLRDVLEERKK